MITVLTVLSVVYEGSSFASLPTLVGVCPLGNSHSTCGEVIPLYDFDLHFLMVSDVEHFFINWVAICISSFEKCSVHEQLWSFRFYKIFILEAERWAVCERVGYCLLVHFPNVWELGTQSTSAKRAAGTQLLELSSGASQGRISRKLALRAEPTGD